MNGPLEDMAGHADERLLSSMARRFAEEWIDAFNASDLDRILALYSPAIELVSPLYHRFTGGRTDTIRGIADLRAYFDGALGRFPALTFTLLDLAIGSRSICLRYHSNVADHVAMECFELDAAGRATRALCHYAD